MKELVVVEIRKTLIESLLASKALNKDDIVFLGEYPAGIPEITALRKQMSSIRNAANKEYGVAMKQIEALEVKMITLRDI